MKQALIGAQLFSGKEFFDNRALLIDGENIIDIINEHDIPKNFEIQKLNGPASRKSSLRRWFTPEFAKKNQEIYQKIYSMLENNDFKNFLKAYKLFVSYEDDDEIINKIKTNTLVTTGQFDVGSTPDMAKNLSNQIEGSKYIEIKNGKHLCNIECDKDFNKTIELFINQSYDKA